MFLAHYKMFFEYAKKCSIVMFLVTLIQILAVKVAKNSEN